MSTLIFLQFSYFAILTIIFKVMTLPKHVHGGDGDEDSYDDSSSQETNAIPMSIIQRHESIEDDRPLGAEGGCDTLSMMSTPPLSPPPTPYPWQHETDTFSVSSTISKPYVDHQKALPEVSFTSCSGSISSPISSSTTHDIHSNPTTTIPISGVLIQSTPLIEDGTSPMEEEPNSSEPLPSPPTAPPPPPPL